MREFWIVVFCLLTSPVFAQFEFAKPTMGQAIGIGAERAYSELEAKLKAEQEKVRLLEAEIAALKAKLTPMAAPKQTPTAVFYAWTECRACPGIINDLSPFLAAGGWRVEVEYTDKPVPNTTYPWIKLCWLDKCAAMKAKKGEYMTRSWLERKMKEAGLK